MSSKKQSRSALSPGPGVPGEVAELGLGAETLADSEAGLLPPRVPNARSPSQVLQTGTSKNYLPKAFRRQRR